MSTELQALHSLMKKENRTDPVSEALFCALETAVLLISLPEAPAGSPDTDRLEILREAVSAARATATAASYALRTFVDAERNRSRLEIQ